MHDAWACILQIAVFSTMLLQVLGVGGLVAILVLAVVVPFTASISKSNADAEVCVCVCVSLSLSLPPLTYTRS